MTTKATWSLVVLYENTQTRETAAGFCDYLVEQMWVDSGLDVNWWSFDGLRETGPSAKAAEKAKDADWVIFALRAEQEVPAHLKNWIEAWLARRGTREGTLVGLLHDIPAATGSETQCYLRQVAHRAGMDYLSQVPQSVLQNIPEARDSYSERANQLTSVLNDILHRRSQPPPPLL